MEKIWLKSYPQGVSPEINLNQYQNLVEVFDEACRVNKGRPAYTNMGVTLTYDKVEELASQFGSFLQNELKLKKGDRIAIQMPNVLQFPIAVFGAFKAGLIVVNTNPLYTAKEMEHQFKDSGVKAIVILANFASHLESIIAQTQIQSVVVTEIADLFPFPKSLVVNSVVKFVKKMVPEYNLPQAYRFNKALELGATSQLVPVPLGQNDIAFLQYTGGTTGVAKGAVLSHKNILANMLQIVSWMGTKLKKKEEIAITALPMYHIFSLTVNCLAFMWFGAQNILITNPRDIKGFLKELSGTPFTIMTGVNTLFNALMNHPDFKKVDFSKVKISVAGAMALQRAVAEKWKELTNTNIVEGFGLTETSPVVCVNPITGGDKTGSIGLPVPSTEVKFIDDDGNEVKQGEPGELCVRGPQVMQGYWNRPEETANVLSSDGWLKTGDIAQIDSDGFVKIVDRKKDMILVSGFNVYPNEVEDAIATNSKVLEVAAVGVKDEHSGEVVKVFVVKKEPTLTEKEVIDWARKSLTNYKVPKFVEFRTELPKTNVGKILRRALR
jgi:long-chain acyl-CoA synthetase